MNKSELQVIHETNHYIVVIKPSGILSQADSTGDIDMLSLVREYLRIKYNKPGNVYLGLIHRLDRPVEGLLVFAKTSKAASRLSKQITDNKFTKTYYAVVENKINNQGSFTNYLTKDESTNTSYVTTESKGKKSILEYKLIDYKDNLSLVKINLITGRHHQIRVQFSYNGYPLYGDHKYNKNFINENITNIALIAKELSFYHPTTKELLTFEIDLPNKYPYSIF